MENPKSLMPTTTLEMSISCKDLKDSDTLSKSDPMCVIYHVPLGADDYVELMRTEVIKNNLSPEFEQKATVEYRFEEKQMLKFEVYDIDNPTDELEDQDFLGQIEISVAQIVALNPKGLTLPLTPKKEETDELGGKFCFKLPRQQNSQISMNSIDEKENEEPVASTVCGSITILAEELPALKDEVTLKFGGESLATRRLCFMKPKTHLVISRTLSNVSNVLVYRSQPTIGENPTFLPATIPIRRLCNGNKSMEFKIEIFQRKRSLGYCLTTLQKLLNLGTGGIPLSDAKSGKVNSSPLLVLLMCKIEPYYTFVDYVQNGTQINCCVAIDFTFSNGVHSDPTSLHNIKKELDSNASGPQQGNNPYQQAIRALGSILEDYDSDKLFPVFGFGAKIPPRKQVSHNFPVNLTENVFCYRVDGILESYENCLTKIELYAPTNFSPIIAHVSEIARKDESGEKYYVLIIITDGVITDMEETKEAIVNAAQLPISIIIIGVGEENFKSMEVLDGDSVRISFKGRKAERDIVQFVPFRDTEKWLMCSKKGAYPQGSDEAKEQMVLDLWQKGHVRVLDKLAQEKLAQVVLAEIPDQFTGYMKKMKIFPSNVKNKPFISKIGENGENG